MKLHINKENISKVIVAGVLVVVLIGGGLLVKKLLTKKAVKYPLIKQEVLTGNELTRLEYNGVTYMAPEGYTLEVNNGHVYGIKRYYIIDELKETVLEDGTVGYVAPEGYFMVDGLAYREIIEIKEPIIVGKTKTL